MKEKFSHSIRVLFAAVLLLVGILPGVATPAHAQQSPDFGIGMAAYFVNGWNWPLYDLVTLTVDDPATPVSPDYQADQYPYQQPDEWNPDYTAIQFDLDFQLKLGFVLEMSNGATTVNHTVEFEVTNVSLLFDQVSGKAVPGDEIIVSIDDYENSTYALRRVITDLNGLWVADFTQPGDGDDEQVLMDLASANQSVQVGSESGYSHTYYASSLPVPFLSVFMDREASAWDIRSPVWPANTAVTLEIDDPDTAQSPDYSETHNTKLHPRYPYVYRVDFYLDGFQIEPGMQVTITDGFTAMKQLTVKTLQVTQIDISNDRVCGYAPPNAWAQVEVDGPEYTVVRYVETDSNGYWCADFSVADPDQEEWDNLDIVPGVTGLVLVSDDDGDHTVMEFEAPSGPDIDNDGTPDLEDPCPADPTDTCDADGSTAATIDTNGGTLVTENQAVSMEVPPSALPEELTLSITDAGSGYMLSDLGQAKSVLAVDIEPSGTHFNVPVTMVFEWPDADNDGVVDGKTIYESSLVVIKDGVVITGTCATDQSCDMDGNSFTVQVTSLSTFALGAFPAPEIISFIATAEPVKVGALVLASASIQDTEQGNSYTLTWDWGDGSTTLQENVTGVEFQATHNYIEAGVYSVQLTVSEGEDGSDTATFEYVVVYDPDGGFVTGGGWIASPAGACRFGACSEDTTGVANFGFVSKYKKGANVPTGNTEFNFKAGGLNFKSTSYQWLVVAGSKAMYKGFGTINGSGNYGFMISAIDAALTSAADQDTFRIKIWDALSETVVYDNQMGASEDAQPATAIGGGSIVIHK